MLSFTTRIQVETNSVASKDSYIFNESGVFMQKIKTVKTKSGSFEKPENFILSQFAITISGLFIALEDDERFVELYVADVKKSFLVPLNALNAPFSYKDQLADLAKLGFDLAKKAAGQHTLGDALFALAATLWKDNEIEKAVFPKKAGWHFLENGQAVHYLPGREKRLAGIQQSFFEETGDKAAYFLKMQELLKQHKNLGIVIGTALSGFLREFIKPDNNNILHIYDNNESSHGKSLALKIAASMLTSYTTPSVFRSWDVSRAGIEPNLVSLNDAFICLDEIQDLQMSESASKSFLMKVTNGYGSSKAKMNGTARDVLRWVLTILSVGNQSITTLIEESDGKQGEALLARIFEIEITKHGVFDFGADRELAGEQAKEIRHFFEANHGFAYDKITAKIAADPKKYIKIFDDFSRALREQGVKAGLKNSELRKLDFCALIGAGVKLAEDVFELNLDATLESLVELSFDSISKTVTKTENIGNDIVSEIETFFDTYYQNFTVNSERGSKENVGKAEVYDDELRKIWIKTTAWQSLRLSKSEKDKFKELARIAKAHDCLMTNADRLDLTVANLGKCYVFDVVKLRNLKIEPATIPF
jgi:hypothetical protein